MAEENTAPEQGAVQDATKDNTASLDLVMDVAVRVTVEVGSARLQVRDVLQFGKGSVIELDRGSGEPADLLVNGRLLARGEVTVVDERLAVRVLEMVQAVPGAKA
jgi:flagellar motor switch protein FliN/FliY